MIDWSYDAWPSGEPYEWMGGRRDGPYDLRDFHVDLGCGRIKKGRIGVDRYPAPGVNVVMDLDKLVSYAIANEPGQDAVVEAEDGYSHWRDGDGGQHEYMSLPTIGRTLVGRPEARAVGYTLEQVLPFPNDSIESIISYHALEHIGDGFIPLMDEIYRVLQPGGLLRAITPLFPSYTAVADPDHRRYFMEGWWRSFEGTPGDDPQSCWLGSFSVPYTGARFKLLDEDMSPPTHPQAMWTTHDAREIRVALEAVK